jgi:hypothetical protein
MGCSIFRDSDNNVQKVLASNGQPSKLFSDIMNLEAINKDQEMAVDMYLLAYTPAFKAFFGDFELGEQKGIVDSNNEPFVSSVLNYLQVPIEQPSEPVEEAPVMYQLDSKEVEAANEELDKHLLEFLKQFGVQTKQFDSLKERLGVDALGATDVLNKLIWYVKNRRIDTLPEEAGHMIVMLMGEENPIIKELLAEIPNWSEFYDVYEQYMPIYKNEKQVRIEAVGKLLAQSLVGNYKKYGTNKNLIQRALLALEEFINKMLSFLSLNRTYVFPSHLADKIALNVLAGNKDFIFRTTNNKQQLDYQLALEKNPLAASVIQTFAVDKFNYKLVGSLAIAAQGETIYRPMDELIHDLDFEVDNTIENDSAIRQFMEDNDFQPVHFGWKQKGFTTLAWYITAPGYKLEVVKRDRNGWAKGIRVMDPTGRYLTKKQITRDIVMAVDFFMVDDLAKNTNPELIYKKWADIYAAKMTLSPLGGDERMFSRTKDQEDYVRMGRPKELAMSLPQFVYYQLDPETKTFKKEILKKANSLQQEMINDLLFESKPNEPTQAKVILEPLQHVYVNTQTGQEYKSVTTAIKGKLDDPEGLYELNRLFGNDFDKTLQDIVLGKTYEQAKANMSGVLSEDLSKRAYESLQSFLIGLTADGSIVLPQVILADDESGIAGSLDIFIIKPDGKVFIYDLKVSKNSFKTDAYRNKKWDVSEESVFMGDKLTTQQQHGIQVAAYKRLAEINGYQIEGISTIHILLDVEGKEKNQQVKDFTWEGVQDHLISANENFVDKFIPTRSNANKVAGFRRKLGLDNPANDPDFLTAEEALPEENAPQEMVDQLTFTVREYVDKLRQRLEYLKNLNKSRFSVFSEISRDKTVDRISELLTSIETEDIGKPSQSFGRLLRYTKEVLDNLYRYMSDPDSIKDEGYIDVILEAEKFIESYRNIAYVPELALGNTVQLKDIRDIQSRLNAVQAEIMPALESYVKNLIRQQIPDQNVTEEELTLLLKEGFDIQLDELTFSDMQNTKEKLLAVAANLFTEAVQKSFNRVDEWAPQLRALGNKLATLSGTKRVDFSYMLNFDSEGNFTGKYLQAIGEAYYKLRREVYDALKDENGENMQYIIITDLNNARPEDIQHNIQLFAKREKLREFNQYERLEGNNIVGGEYHQLSNEYINERAKYMMIDARMLQYGEIFWVPKPGIPDDQYRQFRDKYMDRVEFIGTQREKGGVYAGRTKGELQVAYFPKKQYVQIREISATGRDMRDVRYIKVMNPTNELESAQKEFYLFFMDKMKDLLEKLPIDVQRKMLGNVARVRDNYLKSASKKGVGHFKAFTQRLRQWFDVSPKVHSVQRLTDDDGVPVDNLPILFTNDARNEKKINSIKEKIKDLKDSYIVQKAITTEEYEKKLKNLELSLAIENGKISFNEINLDLVDNLLAFGSFVEKYDQMANIESSLLALSKIVEKKKYFEADSMAKKLLRKGKDKKEIYKPQGESLAYTRFKKWFKMVYYNNDEHDYSTFAQIANRLQNTTSLLRMGLNVFGGVNNYVIGRINNAIEAYGGQFYETKAYFRSTKAFNTEHLPGVMAGLGEKVSSTNRSYLLSKPHSKYEALVQKFRMVRKFQADAGRVDAFGFMYIVQESGEYNVQSKTGVAVTMSTNKFVVTNKETGETASIYDAHDFDPNTGELTLKKGYEMSEEDKTRVTTYIYEVNKLIHGNYAWEDRMVIQQYAIGQLAAQFHKWVYPLYKARFAKRYNNAVLGDIEGRYRTFYNVMKQVYQTEEGFFGKAAGMLKAIFAPGTMKGSLDEMQIANMYKNLAELGFFFASVLTQHLFMLLASGLDDDDEEVKKLMNFMIYQQTRQQNEIKTFVPILGIKEQYQIAKSPIASLSTLRDWGEATSSVLLLPFPPYDNNYYERGPFKGDLKAWKQVRDVIPAFGILNRWESFETVRSFYIK